VAVSLRLPPPSTFLNPGQAFSFTLDDTYTSLVIAVEGTTAYSTGSGGAQSGYTVEVVDNADGTHTLSVSKTAGWLLDVTDIDVVENESGNSETTSWTYDTKTETEHPEGTNPYNATAFDFDFDAIHENVDAEIVNVEAATAESGDYVLIEDASSNHFKKKVDVAHLVKGQPTEVQVDGVTQSTQLTKLNLASPLETTEPVSDEFDTTLGPKLHSLTSHGGSGTCDILVQLNGLPVSDEAGNITLVTGGAPHNGMWSMGYVPGTQAATQRLSGPSWRSNSGDVFEKYSGDAFSVYGMVWLTQRTTFDYYIFTCGRQGGFTPRLWCLYADISENTFLYLDHNATLTTGVPLPTERWCHMGFTRDASDTVRLYLNGALHWTSEAHTAPASIWLPVLFGIGSQGTSGSRYLRYGHVQSVKMVNAELTEAQMTEEARRMFGK
jgi:hypothetical protein